MLVVGTHTWCLSLPEPAIVLAEDVELVEVNLILDIFAFATFIVLVDQNWIAVVRPLVPTSVVQPTFAISFVIVRTVVPLDVSGVVGIVRIIGGIGRLLSRHTFTHFNNLILKYIYLIQK